MESRRVFFVAQVKIVTDKSSFKCYPIYIYVVILSDIIGSKCFDFDYCIYNWIWILKLNVKQKQQTTITFWGKFEDHQKCDGSFLVQKESRLVRKRSKCLMFVAAYVPFVAVIVV